MIMIKDLYFFALSIIELLIGKTDAAPMRKKELYNANL